MNITPLSGKIAGPVTSDELGGKGFGLIRLLQQGYEVPPGFVVNAGVFEALMHACGGDQILAKLCGALLEDDIDAALKHAAAVRQLIEALVLPEELMAEIERAIAAVDCDIFAVRSSAACEDGATYSWAGQFESILSVPRAEIMPSIKLCWKSAYSERAVHYAWKTGHSVRPIRMAVVVQQLIVADVAGVLFTKDPLVEGNDRFLTEFCHGTGELLVSGSVTPYQLRMLKSDVEQIYISDASCFPPLWEDGFRAFMKRLLKLEDSMGHPCDIEWVFGHRKFHVVQCRPITTRPAPATSLMVLMGKKWSLHVSRTMSVFHTALMMEGHGRRFDRFGLKAGLRFLAIIDDGRSKTRAYIETESLSNYVQQLRASVMDGETFARILAFYETGGAKLTQTSRAFQQECTPASYTAFREAYCDYTGGLSLSILAGNALYATLRDDLAREKINTPVDEAAALLAEPTDLSPYQSARREMLALGASIQAHPSQVDEETILRKWLEDYRHVPVNFCERPWTFVDAQAQLKSVLASSCQAELDKLQTASAERRAQCTELLSMIRAPHISDIAERLQKITHINEFRKEVFCHASLALQRTLKRLATLHKASSWRDLYGLMPDELGQLIGGRASALNVVSGRKSVALQFLPESGKVEIITAPFAGEDAQAPTQATKASSQRLKGFGAQTGRIVGRARIIAGSYEFDKLRAGDILVAPMTSVDFTPLFEIVGGIVTDEGGITCHAAVIARERGIPCVIGTRTATSFIKDGDTVCVDGSQGCVDVLERESA